MKKSLIIGCVVTLLAVTGLFSIGFWVAAQDEKVFLTEEILIGDKAYAEDISFQINSHWDEKMLWETCVNIGEKNEIDTKFSFYPDGFDYESDSQSEIRFEYSMNFGYGSSANLLGDDGDNDLPYYDVFADVASRTEPGEDRTEIVKLSDYYKYYELDLHYTSEKYLKRYTMGPYEGEWDEYLSNVVAMQIPEQLEFEVNVEKNEDGNVYDVSGNVVGGDAKIISDGIVLKDGGYVYVYAVDDEGLVSGVSETGFGIYKLPFAWGALDKEKAAIIMIEEFGLVYPLDEKILAMKADAAEEELFVLIEREEGLFLQRIKKENMTLLQEFSLGMHEEWSSCQDMQITDEGILLVMYDGHIFYVENQGGDYEMTVTYNLSDHEVFERGSWSRYAYEYEDGRLAFVWSDSRGSFYDGTSSVYVLVLEGETLKFLAHYENSLNHVEMFYDFSNRLHPSQPYQIHFEE